VAGSWQRRGIGREVLGFVLESARRAGAARIFLEVRPSNEVARTLYTAAGFKVVGIRRGYYPAGEEREDAIVLQLELQ
jgi:ribosomal-protein-alanine N-acetyltransferase